MLSARHRPKQHRRLPRTWPLAKVCGCVFFLLPFLLTGSLRAQLSTEDHVAGPGFWPTQGQDSMSQFAEEGSCASCHADISRSAATTSMARNLMRPHQAATLRDHPHLRFLYAPDLFTIETDPHTGVSQYSVTDGKSTESAPLSWVFGTDRVGQSYLFKKDDGNFYESRVTFFRSLDNIGFTPARDLTRPTDLLAAFGRRVGTAELIRCFSCHATAVQLQGGFNEVALRPGVTCEACHGPGAAHVAAMHRNPSAASSAIFDPSTLSPTDSVEFCGSCHGSFWDVKLAHVTGPSTVRSAPYRLVTSKCWGKEGDPRLVCTSCHDPHVELNTDIASYDHTCLACHANGPAAAHPAQPTATTAGSARAPACPVARTKCASCHMPQVYVPEMKNTFTDHRIRIVKPGETFQD